MESDFLNLCIFAPMKRFLALLLFLPLFSQAQFKITVSRSKNPIYFRGTLFDEKNFLAKDTLRSSVLSSKTPIKGGIYYLQFAPSKERIYFNIENNDQFSLTFSGPAYLASAHSSDPKNEVFLNYQRLEKSFSVIDSLYAVEIARGRKFKFAEKAAFFKSKTASLVSFRKKALATLPPFSAVALYFKSLNTLDESIPSRTDYAARSRFFAKIPFSDAKLLFTPTFRSLLVEYLSYFPLQADSIRVGVEKAMSKIDCGAKSYPFVFDYFSSVMKNRNIVGNTEGYAWFLVKYGVGNVCGAFTAAQKKAFKEEAEKLGALKTNALAENIILKDTAGTTQDLQKFASQNDYTLLMFYAPTCDHCQKEVPEIDSIASVIERIKNLKIGRFAVCNEPGISRSVWLDFITKYRVNTNALHVDLPANSPIRSTYDAFSNPTFYLLNRKGEIVAKKISPTTMRKYFAGVQVAQPNVP
jgi:thiol-disulfide isomerase/thioredoxin